jgi:hypothetical protein
MRMANYIDAAPTALKMAQGARTMLGDDGNQIGAHSPFRTPHSPFRT